MHFRLQSLIGRCPFYVFLCLQQQQQQQQQQKLTGQHTGTVDGTRLVATSRPGAVHTVFTVITGVTPARGTTQSPRLAVLPSRTGQALRPGAQPRLVVEGSRRACQPGISGTRRAVVTLWACADQTSVSAIPVPLKSWALSFYGFKFLFLNCR